MAEDKEEVMKIAFSQFVLSAEAQGKERLSEPLLAAAETAAANSLWHQIDTKKVTLRARKQDTLLPVRRALQDEHHLSWAHLLGWGKVHHAGSLYGTYHQRKSNLMLVVHRSLETSHTFFFSASPHSEALKNVELLLQTIASLDGAIRHLHTP